MIELNATGNKVMNTVNNLRSRMPKSQSLLSGQPGGGGSLPSKDPVQVEPKTYFANERTFIQWISAALLLLTVSSIMMGSGNYNGTSSVIAFSSLVLVIYASYVYFRRVKLLRAGDAYGYLDFAGPSILAAGVGLGVFIVFADAVKGSEFLPWGTGEDHEYDNRRFLMKQSALAPPQAPRVPQRHLENIVDLQQVDGKCSRYAMDGINLLEYQPRDIILHNANELIVATPQALVSHPLLLSDNNNNKDKAVPTTLSAFRSKIPDMDIQSMTMVGDDRLFALSVGPSKTELIEFNANAEMESKFLIQDSTSTAGSMVFVPSSGDEEKEEEEGKLYIYLDGTMHSYQLQSNDDKDESPVSSSSLSLVGSINMKVLNRGGGGLVENNDDDDDDNDDDPITAMEYFEGITYVLRERQNMIEAWDLTSATLLAEMPLPSVSKKDKWVGMAFQRRNDDIADGEEEEEEEKSSLRKGKLTAAANATTATTTSVYLHMPLDTFPPQLWSFRLEEEEEEEAHVDEQDGDERSIFSFPVCDGVAMNF